MTEKPGISLGMRWALAAVLVAVLLAAVSAGAASLALYSRTQSNEAYRVYTCQRFNKLYAGFRQQFDQARVTLNRTAYFNTHPVEKQRELDQLNQDEKQYQPVACQ